MTLPAPPQYSLDLTVEVEKNVNGIEMGVLENGIPYLTQTGLAALAGVARSIIFDLSQEWEQQFQDPIGTKTRSDFIRNYLFSAGYKESKLYIEISNSGIKYNAYPDIVCMAILEYYAFEARNKSALALENYRKFSTFGLQKFIYQSLGYTPGDKWKYYHERVSLLNDAPPPGYFIVFNETTGLIVDLINANLTVNHKTIPDISVGRAWGDYWRKCNLAATYGERVGFSHNYPPSFPQSASNPQPANAYPDAALGEFRRWFKGNYLMTKFPKYILSKANILPGGKGEALQIAGIYEQKLIK
ncbi:hypothetical protein [Acetobacter malorum]|uniref:BstA-like C-terminal domain-containing protein n=1 Tax=Acetobacter malorum TaxID=178901 RepID=A0A1Y3G7H9_9PROT|nr:hypothetical protein [Acetobacter malorum]OUJ06653.1 hypothetical protein HK23_14355 [Acetobacter malorum]